MNEVILRESQHNQFVITDAKSDFADQQIVDAIEELKTFLSVAKSTIKDRYAYKIHLKSGNDIEIVTYKAEFILASESCIIEVSNPLSFRGKRYWVRFSGKGGFWTDITILNNCDLPPYYIFKLFAKDVEWVYKKIISEPESDIAELHFDESVNVEIDVLCKEHKLGKKASYETMEKLTFEVFKKILQK